MGRNLHQTLLRIDPALLDISNIKKLIHVVLDFEKVQYSCWSSLFRVTARAYNVLHHIDTTIPTPPNIDATLWAQLDAVVLSWIYATISTDLLMAVLDEKSTAADTWTCLRDLFQRYNKNNTHQKSSGTALYSRQPQPQPSNILSNYVEQQPMHPRQKRKLSIDLNEGLNIESEYVDLISCLSDDVLVYLLSLAEMKTAGRTSLLSKRWRHVWTHRMDLNFDDPETTAIAMALTYACYPQPKMDKYVKWVNQVISANRAPYLNTFRIHFPLNNFYADEIDKWLKFAFSKEVRNLEINLLATFPRIHFLNIFSTTPAFVVNTTLESLHLESVFIDVPLLEWVISNCLNLQRLSLHSCKSSSDSSSKHQKLVVSSLKLKHLEFFISFRSLNIEALHLFARNLTSFIFFETKIDVDYHSVPSFVDAAFGGPYCRHIFHELDTLSGFSSQLEKLSVQWCEVRSATSAFPTFVNVKQLEIGYAQHDGDPLSLTSLIEACSFLHTFKLKLPSCVSQLKWPNSAPQEAQVNAIRPLQHLKAVEYAGYGGCASAAKLALFLTRHAPMLNKFIFDPHQPLYVGKQTNVYSSEYRRKLETARSHAELLAKQIRRDVDVVIL